MLYPLFDRECNLIAWIEPNRSIFDTDMQWIAYISSNHAWSSDTGNWLGPVRDTVCYDTNGKVFAWSTGSKILGMARPARPTRAARAARPARPAKPARPARPVRPATPAGGWSSFSLHGWLNQ